MSSVLKNILIIVLVIIVVFEGVLIWGLYEKMTTTQAAPQNRITTNQISYSPLLNSVCIREKDVFVSGVQGTGSMQPTIGFTSDVLFIVPADPSELAIGDIIMYQVKDSDETIVHRIIGTGFDQDGVYYKTKGDANAVADKELVRWGQVRYVVIGIIY